MPLSFFETFAASPSKSFRTVVGAFVLGLALARTPLIAALIAATLLAVIAWRPQAWKLLGIVLVAFALGVGRPTLPPLALPVPTAALAHLRTQTLWRMRRVLPGPEAALLAGMSIGDTSGMPQWMKLRFRKTGTTHLLAVSGANLTIAAGALIPLLFLCGLRRRAVAFGAAAGIVWFAAFTGGEPPVTRAACMALLILCAREFGRTPDRANLLLAAAALMLAVDPKLRDSISFLLSMAATAGLLWLSPLFAARLPFARRLPEFLRRSVSDGLAALLATLPITVGSFGNFSSVALLANMVAAPFVPLLTIGGGLLAFVSIVRPLAFLAALPLAALADLLLAVLGWCAAIPGAYLSNGAFPLPAAVLWYAVLILMARLPAGANVRTLSPNTAT